MQYVWLVIRQDMLRDDVVSIWTTEELAKSAKLYHLSKFPRHIYNVKKWELNVTINQWN